MNKKSSLINTKVEGKELNKFLNKTTKELKKHDISKKLNTSYL